MFLDGSPSAISYPLGMAKSKAAPVQHDDQVIKRLNRIRLRHLNCFLEIVRTGSARSAADALFVTESAVSKTVRELESELGLRLFDRARSGMVTTDAGKRFSRYAQSAVDALKSGINAANPNADQTSTLRIGAMPVIAATVLPEVIDHVLRGMPRLTVEIVSGSKGHLLGQLRKAEIAFVLGRLPPPEDLTGLSFEQLFVDRYIFVVNPQHPLAGKPGIGFRDISMYPMAMPSRDTVTWQELQRAFVANGAALSPSRLETIYLQLSKNYVLRSNAVWACSASTARQDIQDGILVKLPVDSMLLESPLGIITRPGNSQDALDFHAAEILSGIRAYLPATA